MKVRDGIFCIENDWEDDLGSEDSIRGALEFLSKTAPKENPCPLVFRSFLTIEDLSILVKRWKRSKYHSYKIVYLAAHGSTGQLRFNGKSHTIDEVGGIFRDYCKGKVFIVDACSALNIPKSHLAKFLKVTKAAAVVGYRSDPDWVEGTALNLILLSQLWYFRSPVVAKRWMDRNCKKLMSSYGFVFHIA